MHTLPVSAADPAAVARFVEVPFALRRGDPLWVPPIRASVERAITGRDRFGSYARTAAFVCERDGADVGRVAAIVNPRLLGTGGAPLGQVGYFESIDDEEVAKGLFAAAADWLRAAGAREVVGPMNGGAHREHRLMTRGFEREPFLFEPRTPPFYPRLFEAAGFGRVRAWQSYDMTRDSLAAVVALVQDGVARVRAAGTHHAEALDPGDVAGTLARLHPILDGVWAGHTGYAPFDLEELGELFTGLLALMTPRHISVLVDSRTRRDVGLAYHYPDYAAEVRALGGDAAGWGAWLAEGRRPRGVVLHTIAVLPEVRRTGAAYLLVNRNVPNVLEDGFEAPVVALVDEDFKLFGKAAPPTREYALYGRAL
jgi:hypothetical protein